VGVLWCCTVRCSGVVWCVVRCGRVLGVAWCAVVVCVVLRGAV